MGSMISLFIHPAQQTQFLNDIRENNFAHINRYITLHWSNPNAFHLTDAEGNTALILAARAGQLHTVEQLINISYFDLQATNNIGLTAAEEAWWHGHKNIVDLLQQNSKPTFEQRLAALESKLSEEDEEWCTCPVTLCVMEDPRKLPTQKGTIYERSVILKLAKSGPTFPDPLTREPVNSAEALRCKTDIQIQQKIQQLIMQKEEAFQIQNNANTERNSPLAGKDTPKHPNTPQRAGFFQSTALSTPTNKEYPPSFKCCQLQ